MYLQFNMVTGSFYSYIRIKKFRSIPCQDTTYTSLFIREVFYINRARTKNFHDRRNLKKIKQNGLIRGFSSP